MFRQKIKTTTSWCFIDEMALVHYSVSMSPENWKKTSSFYLIFFRQFFGFEKFWAAEKYTACSTKFLGDYRSMMEGRWTNG